MTFWAEIFSPLFVHFHTEVSPCVLCDVTERGCVSVREASSAATRAGYVGKPHVCLLDRPRHVGGSKPTAPTAHCPRSPAKALFRI